MGQKVKPLVPFCLVQSRMAIPHGSTGIVQYVHIGFIYPRWPQPIDPIHSTWVLFGGWFWVGTKWIMYLVHWLKLLINHQLMDIATISQWPFHEPKLEIPTIYKVYFEGYVRGYNPNIWLYMAQYLQFRYLKLQLTPQLDNCTTCFTQSLSIGVSPISLDQFWNSLSMLKALINQKMDEHAIGPHSWWVILRLYQLNIVKHPLDLPISLWFVAKKRRQPEPSWPHRSSKPGHFTGSLGRIGAMAAMFTDFEILEVGYKMCLEVQFQL